MNWNGEAANPVGIEWPYNLMQQVEVKTDDPLEHICSEEELLLAMCLSSMTDRERDVVMRRYYHQKTLKEVGEEIGVKQERVRQIEAKAIRKMRNTHCSYIMLHGIKAYIDKRVNEKVDAELEFRKKELEVEYRQKIGQLATEKPKDVYARVLALTIEELDLTVRSYNCLKRAWCETVKDIVERYPTYKSAMNIRNLGRKSLREISEKMNEIGVNWPTYEDDDERLI